MMKVYFPFLVILVFSHVAVHAQVSPKNYNLDFKLVENNLPAGWQIVDSEGYVIGIDSSQLVEGRSSLMIKSNGGKNAGAGVLVFDIPHNLKGKSLTFAAQIKTEGVSKEGSVGIYGSIQPEVDFQNLEHLNLNGTQDWRLWSITLKLVPEETDKTRIGLYLIGDGKVWFNDLRLFVDDMPYTEASIYQPTADSVYKSSSQLAPFELNHHNQQLLKNTALVWGLIKYFHPAVAQGNWNMDTELFKFLPKILSLPSEELQEIELINWIRHFGEIPSERRNRKENSEIAGLKLRTDLTWIANLNYSDKLKNMLLQLSEAEVPYQKRYVEYFEGTFVRRFEEFFYRKANINDVGLRLLGLFRYWNIIHYFSPYRYLTEQPWEGVLDEFIPAFHEANSFAALDSTYLRLFSKINDGHAFAKLSSTHNATVFGSNNVGFKIKFIDNKAVVASLGVDSLGREAGLLVGDIISEVDDIPILEYIQSRRPLIAASHEKVALKYMESRTFQTDRNVLKLKFSRNNVEKVIDIPTIAIDSLHSVPEKSTEPFNLINNRIGYVAIGKFNDQHLEPLLKLMDGKEGLIFDYRDYPIADLNDLFSNYLFPEKKTFAHFTGNRDLSPGEFAVSGLSSVVTYNPNYFKGKVVILIDESTQSAAETQVMDFQTIPGITVIGRNTAGANGNIFWIPLPLGFETAFSGIGVYYPDGRETQGIGIVPDIYVELTSEDVKNKVDRILETAIRLF